MKLHSQFRVQFHLVSTVIANSLLPSRHYMIWAIHRLNILGCEEHSRYIKLKFSGKMKEAHGRVFNFAIFVIIFPAIVLNATATITREWFTSGKLQKMKKNCPRENRIQLFSTYFRPTSGISKLNTSRKKATS